MSTKKQVFSNCQPFYNLSLLAPAHDFQNFCLPETLFFTLLSFLPAFFSFCSLNFNVWISIHYIFQKKSRYCGLEVCKKLHMASCFPGGADSKKICLQCRRPWFSPWVWDTLEKGVATHSSILVWSIPWIEEPGGLQSMGSPRVGHNSAIN